jgi:TPR repeat protein
LFQLAAAQGESGAEFNIGLMYELGKGVQRDQETAVSWYRKAAAQGLQKAVKKLSDLYPSQSARPPAETLQALKDKYDACVTLLGAAECTDLEQRLDEATRAQGPTHEQVGAPMAAGLPRN